MDGFRNVDANEWVCTRCQNVVPAIPNPKKPNAKPVCGECGSTSIIPAGTPRGIKILSPLGTEVIGKLKNPPKNPVGVIGIIGFLCVASCIFFLLITMVDLPKMSKPKPVAEERELTPQEKQAQAKERFEALKRQKLLESQTKTLKFYQPKAEQGDPYAQYRLGMIYLNGEGVTNDVSTARAWFEKSAAQGQDEAKKELTKMTQDNGQTKNTH